MRPVFSYVSAGLVAGFVTLYAGGFPLGFVTSLTETAAAAPTPATGPAMVQIERAKKSDRLAAPAPSSRQRPEIATMEVTGGPLTSVVYRDRTGRILFESDSTRNRTVVAKGVKVPEMTVRSGNENLAREKVRSRSRERRRAPQPPAKLLTGCDPMFSPITDPALANLPGRCLASASGPII